MAFYNSNINIQLPVNPPTDDPELYNQLSVVYNAIRLLQAGVQDQLSVPIDLTAYPPRDTITVGNSTSCYVKAGESLTYGHIVTFGPKDVNSGAVARVFKANANYTLTSPPNSISSGRAQGIVITPGTTPTNGTVQVMLQGITTAIAGIVAGIDYYLETNIVGLSGTLRATPIGYRALSATPIFDLNNNPAYIFNQYVGFGIETGVLYFNPAGHIDLLFHFQSSSEVA